MGSLLADYLHRKLHDLEIALSDLESSAETPEDLAKLEQLTALQDALSRQLRAVAGVRERSFA